MIYVSTRGGVPAATYSEIVLGGLARDGGLYVPKEYPQVSKDTLWTWRSLSYAHLAMAVMSLFADDLGRSVIAKLCQETYTEKTFGHGRKGTDFAKITPLHPLDSELSILELSNGPTLAFKDIAMQYLGALFENLLSKRDEHLNILAATSGDTGSSAEYAMRGREGIKVFMLSPYGRMSDFQKAQMYSLMDPNIFNIAIEGDFDDCQDLVKEINSDLKFKKQYSIGAVNSINWARIAAQVVYYFSGWLQAVEDKDEEVTFSVPTGNFGDVLAGWIAKQMGLPIKRLIVATNENDVLYEFFRSGRYRIRDSAHTYKTSSPSMDISKASNFERYIYDITGHDSQRVNELWDELRTKKEFLLNATEWQKVKESGFVAAKSTHAERLKRIREVWDKYQFLVDPHTADGINAALKQRIPGIKTICLETALPAKFAGTIKEACGFYPPIPEGYENLLRLPQRVEVMGIDQDTVKSYIAENS
ncbi:MAG: threonine synthase [Burkholderiales bacterium]|nr:threonine synthase [Burkholderiales bacterium]